MVFKIRFILFATVLTISLVNALPDDSGHNIDFIYSTPTATIFMVNASNFSNYSSFSGYANNSNTLDGLDSTGFWVVGTTQSVGTGIKTFNGGIRGTYALYDASAVNSVLPNSRYLLDSSGNAVVDYQSKTLKIGSVNKVDWGNAVSKDSSNTNSINWQSRLLFDLIANQSIDYSTRRLKGRGGIDNLDYYNNSGINVLDALGINTESHFLDTQLFIKGEQYINQCEGTITACNDLSTSACNYVSGCNTQYCSGSASCGSASSEYDCEQLESSNVCVRSYSCQGTLDCTGYGYDDCNSHSSVCSQNGYCDGNPGCSSYSNPTDCSNDIYTYGSCYWTDSCLNNGDCSYLSTEVCGDYSGCSNTYSTCSDSSQDCSYIGNQALCTMVSCSWSSGADCGYINGGLGDGNCNQLPESVCTSANTNGYCLLNKTVNYRNFVIQAGLSQTNDTFQCLSTAGVKKSYIDYTCNTFTTVNVNTNSLSTNGTVSFVNSITTQSIIPSVHNKFNLGGPTYSGNFWNYSYISTVLSTLVLGQNMNATTINTTNINSRTMNTTNITARQINAVNINSTYEVMEQGNITTTNTNKINFNSNVGSKINFYSGANYQIGINNNLLEISTSLGTDRVGIGWGGTGSTFKEILTVKDNYVGMNASLNQSGGNATINMVYGEMWNKSDSGFATVDLATTDVYVIVRNLSAGNINGFSFTNSNLTAQIKGVYKVSVKIGVLGSGSGGENGMKIFINETGQDNCYDHEHTSSVNPIGFIIECIINLNVGDKVNIRFDDHNNPVNDLTLLNGNVNLVRVGN